MLLTRQEMTFDFGGARFDPVANRAVLGWLILRRAVRQEERHVDFGERQTMRAVEGRPALKRRLLGFNIASLWAARRLGASMDRLFAGASPVMRSLPRPDSAVRGRPRTLGCRLRPSWRPSGRGSMRSGWRAFS